MSTLLACSLSLMSLDSHALMLGERTVADAAQVANATLALNGAGIRSKAYFKVYLAALYLDKLTNSVSDILADQGPQRLQITFLRDVGGGLLSRSMQEGLDENCSESEHAQFAASIESFAAMFGSLESVHEGDVINLDWVPDTGMVATVNGRAIRDPLPDREFYNLVLRIWLGEHPASNDLKQRLLGVQLTG
ncbi:chalcone isomerase family protein [Burkholderiaceae bacterium DAT-1]|nr:chalcone isomerase family protein [Burkholderiaceae bacterium DAT-1]